MITQKINLFDEVDINKAQYKKKSLNRKKFQKRNTLLMDDIEFGETE